MNDVSSVVSYAELQKEWVACPICSNREFTVLTRRDRYRMGVSTAQCAGCGLVMTNPMPVDDALRSFYRDVYRLYYRKIQSPSVEHIRELQLTERAQYTAAFLRAQGVIAEARSVLDVGCAEGSLLRAIAAGCQQMRRTGIEPNPHFASFARDWAGARVHAELAELDASVEQFDLITVNHVLEHVRDPVGFLKKLAALLKPGGTIYVDVPNAIRYSSLADLHVAHLFHFTSTALRNLTSRAGLSLTHAEQHDPPRHPRSLRILLKAGPAAEPQVDHEAAVVRRRIAAVTRMAPLYFLRRSRLGRIFIGPPARAWRILRS